MCIKHLLCGRHFIKRNDTEMKVSFIGNAKILKRKCMSVLKMWEYSFSDWGELNSSFNKQDKSFLR